LPTRPWDESGAALADGASLRAGAGRVGLVDSRGAVSLARPATGAVSVDAGRTAGSLVSVVGTASAVVDHRVAVGVVKSGNLAAGARVCVGTGERVAAEVAEGMPVLVAVGRDVRVGRGVDVGRRVHVAPGPGVADRVGVGVTVGVRVIVGVRVMVGVRVGVGVPAGVCVAVGVELGCGVDVMVAVFVGRGVAVGVAVGSDVGATVGVSVAAGPTVAETGPWSSVLWSLSTASSM